MDIQDKARFSEIMTTCGSIYGKTVDTAILKIFWSMMQTYPLAEVDNAFHRFMTRGKFFPRPAEILELMPSANANKHIPENEAWAMCLKLTSELDSVVITTQMRDAWHIASKVLAFGDKVGARMAFKDAYERLTTTDGQIVWELMRGDDKAQLALVAAEAIKQGKLSPAYAKHALPPVDTSNDTNLLEGLTVRAIEHQAERSSPEEVRKRTKAMLAMLNKKIHTEDDTAITQQQRERQVFEDKREQALDSLSEMRAA